MVVFGCAVVVAVAAVVTVVCTLALAGVKQKNFLLSLPSPLSWKLLPYALLELAIMYVMMSTSALASSNHCRIAREKVL